MGKSCKLEYQREYRKRTNGLADKKYERATKSGFLMRVYRNMLSRVTGVQTRKLHLYAGLEILDKETFYAWSLQNADFNRLYAAWACEGQCRRLAPSVDRIDSGKGYTLDNMQWVTFSENCSRGGRNKKGKG